MTVFRLAKPAGISLAASVSATGDTSYTMAPVVDAYQQEGADRMAQPYLFQNVRQPYPSLLGASPANDYNPDLQGPTNVYVDSYGGWRWTNTGGDWIDAAGVAQGSTAFVSFPAATGGAGTWSTYSGIDCTALVRRSHIARTWMALRMTYTGTGQRTLATNWHASQPVPLISCTYTDGTTGTLVCRMVARIGGGSSSPQTIADEYSFAPWMLEFERPTKLVSAATLRVALRNDGGSVGTATVTLNPLTPPLAVQPVTGTTGLASTAGALDAGLDAVPGIMGTQRYVDGASLTDFCITTIGGPSGNINDEASFSPELWGGAVNLTKYPHSGTQGGVRKWVNFAAGTDLTLVNSSYTGESFEPLAAGLGALRLRMPVGVGGASDFKLFLPPDDMGITSHMFTRQYIRIPGFTRTPANKPEYVSAGNWSSMGGKIGISPSHDTSYGGVSATSGGGKGWQMRMAWSECEANLGGPDEAGYQLGWHLYDYGTNNPPGYQYASEGQQLNNWGQQGGLGAMTYSDRWYCIETELKLNSVDAGAGTYSTDGELRTWIDGRLVYERTGMVMRTMPRYDPGTVSGQLRPFRELGIGWLWWNWYNGGVTPSTVERVLFTTGLAYGSSRIGPMKMPTVALPTWVPAAGEVSTLTQTNGRLTNTFVSQCAPYYEPFYFRKINDDYSGTVVNPYWGTYGAIMHFGGGHSATNDNSVVALELGYSTCAWKRLTNPSPIYGSGTDSTTKNNNSSPGISFAVSETTRWDDVYGEYTIDGQPGSPHSYGGLDILGPEEGGAACGSLLHFINEYLTTGALGSNKVPHQIDFHTSGGAVGSYSWRRRSDNKIAKTGDYWTAKVPAQNRVYTDNFLGAIRWLDLTDNTFHTGTGTARVVTNRIGNLSVVDNTDAGAFFHVPERGLVVFIEPTLPSGHMRVSYMDVTVSEPNWSAPVTLSTTLVLPARFQAACWCPDNSRIIIGTAASDTGAVYELEIPATLSSTWTITRAAFGSGQTITWFGNGENTYKKWSYNPRTKAIMYYPRTGAATGTDDTIWVYRPRGT